MDKFSDFISEQKNDKPYRILNLIHDTPDDPNKTGDEIERQAKKMGIDIYQLNIEYGYFIYHFSKTTRNNTFHIYCNTYNFYTINQDTQNYFLVCS